MENRYARRHGWRMTVKQAIAINHDCVAVDDLPYMNDEKDYKRLKEKGDEIRYREELIRDGMGRNYLMMAAPIKVDMGGALAAMRAEKDYMARRHTIPKGPVNLTQALLGDPLPGRSALDKRK
jgi:hypothetical protein